MLDLVENPENRFSHNEAHVMFMHLSVSSPREGATGDTRELDSKKIPTLGNLIEHLDTGVGNQILLYLEVLNKII